MLLKATKLYLYPRISLAYGRWSDYYLDILKKMNKEIEENGEVVRSKAWLNKLTRTIRKGLYAKRKENEYYLKTKEILESLS